MEELLLVASIHLLAVASPGPDFALVLKNALVSGRKAGVYSAIGIGLGILVHVIYSLAGVAALISQSIVLFSLVKYIGAVYLIYIGAKSLINSTKSNKTETDTKSTEKSDMTAFSALKQGFITNVLNPKVTLFFLSLFTQVIDTNTSTLLKSLYGLEMVLATILWFCIVALFFTHNKVRDKYISLRSYMDKAFGAILVGLGVKILMEKNNI